MRWAEARGATVSRHNLTSDPDAFVANTKVTGLMTAFGEQALPALLIDGEIKIHGRYATREELASLLDAPSEPAELPVRADGCGCGPDGVLLMSLPAAHALSALEWTGWETRYLFFTGKGGVGKTTIASGVAVALADAGKRTLIISTDPASNLDDVFGLTAGQQPAAVPGVEGLFVSNLDPEVAAAAFKERAVGPYRGVLPEAAITSMEEQLSGACTVEIAAFNEFTAVLAAPHDTAEFDHVIFDTAPTGHTLRLLTLPSAWSGYVDEHPAGASCLGPLAGLDHRREQYAQAVATLSDPALTTLVLVARRGGQLRCARPRARAQSCRRSASPISSSCSTACCSITQTIRRRSRSPSGRQPLAGAPAQLASFPAAGVRLIAGDVTGLDALRQLSGADGEIPESEDPRAVDLPGVDELIDELDAAGNGVVMTMGKGGVGKTTLAAAIAIALVDRGHEVTLSTTDPAAHVADALSDDAPDGLTVERIDPAVETARYTAEVLAAAAGLDEEGRALLEEDLRSPCTEEIAVFRAFARTVDAARSGSSCSTPPRRATRCCCSTRRRATSARSAHQRARPRRGLVATRAPARPRVRANADRHPRGIHPVQEAQRLRRTCAGPGSSHSAGSSTPRCSPPTTHPTLRARAGAEILHIERVTQHSGQRTWLVAWQPQPPVGPSALRELSTGSPLSAR